MKLSLLSLACLTLAIPAAAQKSRSVGPLSSNVAGTGVATLRSSVLFAADPGATQVLLSVSGADGPAFVAVGTYGPFDPANAFFLGAGKVDRAGNGSLLLTVPDGLVPPNVILEVSAVYLKGGVVTYTPPIRPLPLGVGVAETLDFDFAPGFPDPQKGQIMGEEYALAGVHISAVNNIGSKVGEAIIWDGKSPSGGDFDLLTPNRDQVLIIAENLVDANTDGFVDVPDDERAGGRLIFDFDDPVEVKSLTVVDIDVNETAFARFTHSDASTTVANFASLGDGTLQTIDVTETDVTKLELVFSGSGGLVELDLVPCPFLVNFDERTFGQPLPLQTGEWITDQFNDIGLTISAENNVPGHPDKAILFDSENPTGEDPDLMTPGFGFNNTVPLGKVLIIAEDDVDANMDGLVDDPDDEAGGGRLIFDFDAPVELHGFTILDIDGTEFDFFEAFDGGGMLLGTQQIPPMGNNSVVRFDVEPPLTGVRKVVLNLGGSGAVTRLRFCPEENVRPPQ